MVRVLSPVMEKNEFIVGPAMFGPRLGGGSEFHVSSDNGSMCSLGCSVTVHCNLYHSYVVRYLEHLQSLCHKLDVICLQRTSLVKLLCLSEVDVCLFIR